LSISESAILKAMGIDCHSGTRLSQNSISRRLRITSRIHLPVHAEWWPVSALGGSPHWIRELSGNFISNWWCPWISPRKKTQTTFLIQFWRHCLGKSFSQIPRRRIMSSDNIWGSRDSLEISSHFLKNGECALFLQWSLNMYF